MAAKKKDSNDQESEPLDFLDEVKESDYFQWLIEKRQILPYLFVIVIAVIALLYKISSGRATSAETNYMMAENTMVMLQRSLTGEPEPSKSLSLLERLKDITESYPELHSRYDGLLAQLLLMTGDTEEGEEFGQRCINRVSRDDLPVYSTFSKTTLTTATEAYSHALEDSKELKPKILNTFEKTGSGAELFAYNVFRIAMLEMKAGTPEGELKAWEEWETYAENGENPQLNKAFLSLKEQLQEGEFTLDQYIIVRKNILEKKL